MKMLAWFLLSLACAPTLASCSLFKEDDDGDAASDSDVATPDGTIADAAGDGVTGTEATGLAALFGVSSYELVIADGPHIDFRVTLRGKGGGELGVVDVFADPEGFTGSLASSAGTFTYRSRVWLSGDTLLVRTSFGNNDKVLRLDVESSVDGAGELAVTGAVLVAPSDPDAALMSDPWFDAPNEMALRLYGPDGERGFYAVARFVEAVAPASLLGSPDLMRLIGAMQDPALVAAITTASAAFAPEHVENRIHLSPTCASLRDKVHADPIPPCRKCAELDPDLTAAVPSGVDQPQVMLLEYLPACQKCMLANNVKYADAASCVRAWRRPNDIWTDERCAEKASSDAKVLPKGSIAVATSDGHGCTSRCTPEACTEACQPLTAQGLTVAPVCDEAKITCSCKPDLTLFCQTKYPRTNCGPPQGDVCDVAVCGDGHFKKSCPENPAASETCDAQQGCEHATGAPPVSCAQAGSPDECTCVICQCSDALDCPPGFKCDGCQCTDPGCLTDLVDLVNGQGDWCDWREAERWCGAGRSCDVATCRCSEPVAVCGNQKVDVGEACDASAPVVGCKQGETCTDCECRAPSLCGNGTRDSGEACDPNEPSPPCGVGTKCVACQCVASCGNGVIDDGEACDKAAANTCGVGSICKDNCTCMQSCGNQIVDPGEPCDRSFLNGFPHFGCPADRACLDDCTCGDPVCGNNRQEAAEECDTTHFGCARGSDFCNDHCECANSPLCGNGINEPGEQCDYRVGPGVCGSDLSNYASFLPKCIDRQCRCECPVYAKTSCVLATRTVDCFEGTHCAPAYDTCVQDICPAGAAHLGGDGPCECAGGNAATTLFDACRSPFILKCVPVTP